MYNNNDEEQYTPEYELESVTFQVYNSMDIKENNDASSCCCTSKKKTNNNNNNNQVVTFVVYTVLPPPLEYMSSLYNKSIEISGRKLWPGSLLLSQYILYESSSSHYYYDDDDDDDDPSSSSSRRKKSQMFFENQRILELGSGSGIVGLIVAYATKNSYSPPSCLVLTDGEETSVELMKQNLLQENNKLLIFSDDTKKTNIIMTSILKWGIMNTTENDVNHHHNHLNPHLNHPYIFEQECFHLFPNVFDSTKNIEFDIILAGDVLYKEELPALFFQTVQRYISKTAPSSSSSSSSLDQHHHHHPTPKNNGGILYLCHVPRANVTHEFILHVATQYGFHVIEKVDNLSSLFSTTTTGTILPNSCPMEDVQRACIYKMSLL